MSQNRIFFTEVDSTSNFAANVSGKDKSALKLFSTEDLVPTVKAEFKFSEKCSCPLPNGYIAQRLLSDAQVSFHTKAGAITSVNNCDELLKHCWRASFVESQFTKDIIQDLFWWIFRKLDYASKQRSTMPKRTNVSKDCLPQAGESIRNNDQFRNKTYIKVSEKSEKMKDGGDRESIRRHIDERLMVRIAENYVNLFQKINSDMQTLVEHDDPLDDMDDGMFPEDMTEFPMVQREMHVRTRVSSDSLFSAVPDAIAQAIYEVFQRSCKKMVERFVSHDFKTTLVDICNVLMSGIRPSNISIHHWANGVNSVRQWHGIKTAPGAALFEKSNSVRSTNKKSKPHSTRRSSPKKGRKNGVSTGRRKLLSESGTAFTFRRPKSPPSTPLYDTRQTIRSRLTLGNSRLIESFLKRHEAGTSAQSLKLNITLTTNPDRHELTKSNERKTYGCNKNTAVSSFGSVDTESGENFVEWIMGQPLNQIMSIKDSWESSDGKKKVTVRDAVKDTIAKQKNIVRKFKKDQIEYKRGVKQTKLEMEQAFRIIGNEQKQVTVGDINEWANGFTERILN